MKKIVTTIAALAMAVSMFAADFSATVQVKGDVAYGKSVDGANEFGLLGVEKTAQKLVLSCFILQISFPRKLHCA